MCSRRWACRCRWMSRPRAAASRRSDFTFLFAPYYHPAMEHRAGARRAGRAHGVQYPGSAEQSGRAALPRHRRLRCADRGADGAGAARHARQARLRDSWRRRLGRAHAGGRVHVVRCQARRCAARTAHRRPTMASRAVRSSDLAGGDAAHNARELRRVLCGERLRAAMRAAIRIATRCCSGRRWRSRSAAGSPRRAPPWRARRRPSTAAAARAAGTPDALRGG